MQVLEHVSRSKVRLVIAEFFRVLQPGGLLRLHVPNLERLAQYILNGEVRIDVVIGWIYGGQDYLENFHRWGFTPDTLREALKTGGFKVELLSAKDGLYTEARA